MPDFVKEEILNSFEIVTVCESSHNGVVLHSVLKNRWPEITELGDVCINIGDCTQRPGAKVWVQGETMCGVVGFQPAGDGLRSYGCMGFPATGKDPARLVGALDLREVTVWLELRQDVGEVGPVAIFELDGAVLNAGEERCLPDIIVLEGPSLSQLFDLYGEMSGRMMGARGHSEPVCGWCSWYHYYGYEAEADILANARELSENNVLPAGAVIQIDDGWNRPTPDALRTWGDWMPGCKFPRGIKAVADDVHAMGFKAGLWLAPFSADAASDLALNHPDWLLNPVGEGLLEASGNPVYGLDLTHPEVLGFIDETFDRVFNEWGFDYVKLDFLMHAMEKGARFDGSVTPTGAVRRALERVRSIAGDRFILCCGSPLGPAVGVADAMRVGFDVGSRWHAPMLPDLWPHGNCSVKPAAYPVIHRLWMDGAWWMNDPDCLVVRDQVNRYEELEFDADHPGGDIPAELFGLSEDEAGFLARLVHTAGRMFMVSEVWGELPSARQGLIRKALEKPEVSFCLIDGGDEDLLMLEGEDGMSFAMFNLSDDPVRPSLTKKCRAGLYHEFILEEYCEVDGTRGFFPELAPHAARIWVWQAGDACRPCAVGNLNG